MSGRLNMSIEFDCFTFRGLKPQALFMIKDRLSSSLGRSLFCAKRAKAVKSTALAGVRIGPWLKAAVPAGKSGPMALEDVLNSSLLYIANLSSRFLNISA